jgi:YVTN family beta-propeller protein
VVGVPSAIPVGVAFDSANGDIYVANSASDDVAVISGSTNVVIETIPVGFIPFTGSFPVGVASDSANGQIYVTNSIGSYVSIMSGSANTLLTTIQFDSGSFPVGVAFDSANGNIYITHAGSNTIFVI